MKILKNKQFIKQLEGDGDDVALRMKRIRKEEKRKRKREKKARRRLGDTENQTCVNREDNGGIDNRFAEGYKCDYKLRLYDREKELAHDMSAAQFRDNPSSDEAEDERDMGDGMAIDC